MVTFNSPTTAQDDCSILEGLTHGIACIKIEDEEEDKEVGIELTGLDDDQEGIDVIREITPAERQSHDELPFGCKLLDSAVSNGKTLTPGSSLELRDGNFLHNVRIFCDLSNDEITVDGNLCMRTSRLPSDHLKGMLATNHVNELCLVMRAPSALKDATLAQCRVARALKDAKCERDIILTNKPFPAHSVYDYPYFPNSSIPVIRRKAQLVCRWRITEETIDSGKKSNAGSLMALREYECDKQARASDICLLKNFLKNKKQSPRTHDEGIRTDERNSINLVDDDDEVMVVPKPENTRKRLHSARENEVDLTGDSDDDFQITKVKITETIERITSAKEFKVKRTTSSTITDTFKSRKPSSSNYAFSSHSANVQEPQPDAQRRRYTFGDLCAGGGGITSGAKQAGLKLNFLLDHWEPACKSLDLNFRSDGPHVLLWSIYDFCTRDCDVDYVGDNVLHISFPCQPHSLAHYIGVDVLHISFPCQPHSPAHTREGKNDPDNVATSYSIIPILQKCKPRVVTFEQTSGIVTHNGGVHFRAMIHQLTDSGYSVRWKICNLVEWGNVQARKRLIIVAACPGETLPPFPEPTHGLGPNKLPFVTVHDVLQHIRNVRIPHNLRESTSMNVAPHDPRKPLQHCISCTGSVPHPSGKRSFTLFELAALQGFLPTHRFFGSKGDIRRQIGNAVPSIFAKALFQRITQNLQESDARIAAWKPEVLEVD